MLASLIDEAPLSVCAKAWLVMNKQQKDNKARV